VTTSLAVDGDHALLTVGDDGPGISEENIGRIFTAFFTTKPFGQGDGLGLDRARRIVVEKHQGDIRVESKTGGKSGEWSREAQT